MRFFSPAPAFHDQALARLTVEVDRLSGKIDKLANDMATKSDLAQYASREMVEAKWHETDRRMHDLQNHVEQHTTQLSGLSRDSLTRETRWDWRVIGGLGYLLTVIFGVLASICSGVIVGLVVWFVTHH